MCFPKNDQQIIARPKNHRNLSPVLKGPKQCRPSLYAAPVMKKKCNNNNLQIGGELQRV